jgi:GNAT superfamily N-acetyltransferase
MATDVLGDLLRVDGRTLLVRTRRGEVSVRLDDVLAGRPIPPAPTRRGAGATRTARPPSVAHLLEVLAAHWRAPQEERLGGWTLRSAAGFTGRANSALPLGAPGMPAREAVARVDAWYRARGLTPMAMLPAREPVPAPWREAGPDLADRALERARETFEAAGWRVRPDAGGLTLTVATARLAAVPPDVPSGLGLTLDPTPDAGWLGRYRYRGQALPPHAGLLLRSAPEQVFASVRHGPSTVAVARGSLGHGWGCVTAVDVAPEYRRRGLSGALLAALAAWALGRGARSTMVQVARGNAAALAAYRRAGFEVHHGYEYLVAASSADRR